MTTRKRILKQESPSKDSDTKLNPSPPPRADNNNIPSFNYKEKILTRLVLVSALLAIVYFTSTKEKTENLAKKNEILSRLFQEMACANRRNNLISPESSVCTPGRCGRYVTDTILKGYEADLLLSNLKMNTQSLEPPGDFALDILNGKLYNQHKTLDTGLFFYQQNGLLFKALEEKLKEIIAEEFHVDKLDLDLVTPSLFTYQSVSSSKDTKNETWNIGKTSNVFTAIIYLSTMDASFTGGNLVFKDRDKINRSIDPKLGRAIIFTNGAENEHFIQEITAGHRYALILTYNCSKKNQ